MEVNYNTTRGLAHEKYYLALKTIQGQYDYEPMRQAIGSCQEYQSQKYIFFIDLAKSTIGRSQELPYEVVPKGLWQYIL